MTRVALYVAEGPSDLLLGDLIREEFLKAGEDIRVTAPDLSLLADRIGSDVAAKIEAGTILLQRRPDLVLVHRDANSVGRQARLVEIESAGQSVLPGTPCLGVIPNRATEAWLLTNADHICQVAGAPARTSRLQVPRARQAEALADPKSRLRDLLLDASDTTGRRRRVAARRFNEQRRQLIARLTTAQLAEFESWRLLVHDITRAAQT